MNKENIDELINKINNLISEIEIKEKVVSKKENLLNEIEEELS